MVVGGRGRRGTSPGSRSRSSPLPCCGVHIGQVYLRYHRLLDARRVQGGIASNHWDDVIQRRLVATAHSILGRPVPIRVERRGNPPRITIRTEYEERVEPLFYYHTFVRRPRADVAL